MRGVLVVNGFLRTQKFEEIYVLLQNAAKKQGMELCVKTSDELLCELSLDEHTVQDLAVDFCLFWDKDVSLARRLESAGLPLFNCASAVEICDDKMRTALAFQAKKLPMPKTVFAPKTFETVGYTDFSFLDKAEQALGYPMIIKEAFGSFGQQVYLCENRAQAESTVRALGAKPFLMQEFIRESRGKDLRVNVVGGVAVCGMKRKNERDFRSNVTGGGKAEAHSLSAEEKSLAIAACEAVGADFAGVDLLFGANGMLVCEINSNPHFKSTLECTGVDLSDYIMRHVKARLQEAKE